jgi:hypothetical protein
VAEGSQTAPNGKQADGVVTPADPASRMKALLAAPDALSGAAPLPSTLDRPGARGGTIKGRWLSSQSGNPRGRQKGKSDRRKLLLSQTMDKVAGSLLETTVTAALGGDMDAMRLLWPVAFSKQRGRLVKLRVEVETVPDAVGLATEILRAVAGGEMTIEDGTDFLRLIREVEVIRRLCKQAPGNDEPEISNLDDDTWQASLDLLMNPPRAVSAPGSDNSGDVK